MNLTSFARQTMLTEAQALFALRVLSEIELVSFSLNPFHAALLPVKKRGPEESTLFRSAEEAKEEAYGIHGV